MGHGLRNRISNDIIHQYFTALPSLALGLLLGIILSRFFNPLIFRRIILLILIVVGVRLFIAGFRT
ncbi:MAG: hypothetical protein ACFB14_13765 [Leptolyngbyaceae cyanobacterium]